VTHSIEGETETFTVGSGELLEEEEEEEELHLVVALFLEKGKPLNSNSPLTRGCVRLQKGQKPIRFDRINYPRRMLRRGRRYGELQRRQNPPETYLSDLLMRRGSLLSRPCNNAHFGRSPVSKGQVVDQSRYERSRLQWEITRGTAECSVTGLSSVARVSGGPLDLKFARLAKKRRINLWTPSADILRCELLPFRLLPEPQPLFMWPAGRPSTC